MTSFEGTWTREDREGFTATRTKSASISHNPNGSAHMPTRDDEGDKIEAGNDIIPHLSNSSET